MKAWCSEEYYGANCSTVCRDSNDLHNGYYTCSPDGKKVCRPGIFPVLTLLCIITICISVIYKTLLRMKSLTRLLLVLFITFYFGVATIIILIIVLRLCGLCVCLKPSPVRPFVCLKVGLVSLLVCDGLTVRAVHTKVIVTGTDESAQRLTR